MQEEQLREALNAHWQASARALLGLRLAMRLS
jgi:hypothetical protein